VLAIPEGKTHFACTCDRCGAETYTDENEIDAAISVMRRGGWLPFPTKGQPSEKWKWHCAGCLPKPSSGSMPTTPTGS